MYLLLRILYLALYPIFKLKYLFSWWLGFEFFILFEYYPSIECVVGKMIVLFATQKLFSFMRSWLLIVHLIYCGKGVLFRKSFLVTMSSRLFPNLSSIRLSVSGLMLRSLVHLEWSWFLCRVISMDLFGFFYMPQSNLISISCWRCCRCFSMCIPGFIIKNQVFMSVSVYVCILD